MESTFNSRFADRLNSDRDRSLGQIEQSHYYRQKANRGQEEGKARIRRPQKTGGQSPAYHAERKEPYVHSGNSRQVAGRHDVTDDGRDKRLDKRLARTTAGRIR